MKRSVIHKLIIFSLSVLTLVYSCNKEAVIDQERLPGKYLVVSSEDRRFAAGDSVLFIYEDRIFGASGVFIHRTGGNNPYNNPKDHTVHYIKQSFDMTFHEAFMWSFEDRFLNFSVIGPKPENSVYGVLKLNKTKLTLLQQNTNYLVHMERVE